MGSEGAVRGCKERKGEEKVKKGKERQKKRISCKEDQNQSSKTSTVLAIHSREAR